jgi:4-hydroxybenzoyl-CoA reductase subunit alpha
MEEYSVIGKSFPRIDGISKVTGEAKYTDDIHLPGMLYGKILRSPYPHAIIKNIDISKAKRVKGVKEIITGRDTGDVKYSALLGFTFTLDKHPLAIDKVLYIGDEVAAVAAIDEDIAEEALELIQVDYEELPAVFDPVKAMEPGAPRLHLEIENNISATSYMNFGDIEEGFKEAEYIREDSFITDIVTHSPGESHAALANCDLSGNITVWSSTQVPYLLRIVLSRTLNIDEEKIRVILPHVGGGFGGKAEALSLEICAAFLSRVTLKPVKIIYTREEELSASRRRHSMIVDMKTGVKKDGTITSRYCKNLLDGGAYNSYGFATVGLSGMFMNLPYRLKNVKYDGIRVYTNKPICGAMRGHGGPQIYFAVESQLDMIAEDLGIDPIELRIKNGLKSGEVTPNGWEITTSGFEECIRSSIVSSDWYKIREETYRDNRGIGIGCHGFITGTRAPLHFGVPDTYSSAILRLNLDGSITLFTGAADIGQGSNTVLAQIAAEELGVLVKDIKILSGDSEFGAIDQGSFSSRVTLMSGHAVKSAANEAKNVLFNAVAEEIEANVYDLIAKDGRIYVKGSPDKGLSFKDAIFIAKKKRGGDAIITRGIYNPDNDPLNLPVNYLTGKGNLSQAYSFGAHIAEIGIDKETGKIRVKKMVAAQDIGFPINPMASEGQIEGSVHMGIGYALTERIFMDGGTTLTTSLLQYKIPTSLEMPSVKSLFISSNDPKGVFGAKECSEGTLCSTPPAIANAIYNAVGVRIKEIPITPEKILKALERKNQ